MGSVDIFPRRLSFTTSNIYVKHLRHAFALDERRELESEYDRDQVQKMCVSLGVTAVHVGGGAVANEVPHNLARIPLRWMIRQCFLVDTGIIFHRELLKYLGIDPASLHPVVPPRPAIDTCVKPRYATTEEEKDILDALCPMYEELKIAPGWRILNSFLRNCDTRKEWAKAITMNRGRPRRIPRQYQEGFKVLQNGQAEDGGGGVRRRQIRP
ncbi:hypothetical protein EV421DRAFT_2034302 [Armillaria borealis]|uniref:T6SS Phospholipase effector Tle1-like catalytic domain-containing protein n=1 Tax=Armillaria borealis TaxID=47425 RepID=A0AA39JPW1_9AGAR|nr:hypothetical protein EV421DRAFT_2034302 [Armillaria borealis]